MNVCTFTHPNKYTRVCVHSNELMMLPDERDVKGSYYNDYNLIIVAGALFCRHQTLVLFE